LRAELAFFLVGHRRPSHGWYGDASGRNVLIIMSFLAGAFKQGMPFRITAICLPCA
jgi:hypothetical protein